LAPRRKGRPRHSKAAAITTAIKRGESDSAIAARLGVARSTVRAYRRRLGVSAFSPGENTAAALAARKEAARSQPKPQQAPATVFGLLAQLGRRTLPQDAAPVLQRRQSAPMAPTQPRRRPATPTARANGRRAMPILDSTWRLTLAGCGHVVEAIPGDDVGRVVACRPCGGPRRTITRLLQPGQSALAMKSEAD